MAIEFRGPEGLDLWRRALCESVRRDSPDLSARQMALLLTVYLDRPPHNGCAALAEILNIFQAGRSPARSIAWACWKPGSAQAPGAEADRRSVLVQRTVKGSVFLSEFSEIMVKAADGYERK